MCINTIRLIAKYTKIRKSYHVEIHNNDKVKPIHILWQKK